MPALTSLRFERKRKSNHLTDGLKSDIMSLLNHIIILRIEVRVMNVWESTDWTKHIPSQSRSGIRLKCEKNVDKDLKSACVSFFKWLRTEYSFPIRIPVYLKKTTSLKAADGDSVKGIFFEPVEYSVEPYIKIAAGDYCNLKNKWGRDDAIATILTCIAHELTHYFQWINNVPVSDDKRERQAYYFAKKILAQYSSTRLHP